MTLLSKASLVATPTAYGDGVLNSVKPTDGVGDFSFARASSATRVNEQGLIEKERENLLLNSNNFTTSWVLTGAGSSLGSDVAGPIAGVAGKALTLASGALLYQTITSIPLGVISVYMRVSSGTIDLQLGDPLGSPYSTKTLTTTWQRFSTLDTATLGGLAIYNSISGTTINIEIAAAQVEKGLVATDYIETTTSSVAVGITDNIPRINYENGIGNFLLEPQRTNLIEQSEFFDASQWSQYLFGGATLTRTGGYASPEGLNNAYKLDITTGTGGVLLTHNTTVTASIDYTLSIWMKGEVGGEKVQIDFKNTSSSGITGSLTTLTSEWQRYDFTFTNDSGTSKGFQFRLLLSSGITSQTFYVYGAQLEQGSYPTSYIPTYGSAVTRASETCNNAGNSDLFNDSEGVLYAEIAALANDGTFRMISISDGTGSNLVRFYLSTSSDRIVSQVKVGGVTQSTFDIGGVDVQNFNKLALKYKENDFSIWINGTQQDTDTSGSVPSGLDELAFDDGNGGLPFYGKTKMVSTFTEALSDSELECLTSWSSFNRMATAQNYTIQ